MCGIVAIIGARGGTAELERMVGRLHHRGPDASGVWRDPMGVALGHTRLSIIDLSPGGQQPMHSADGSVHLTFNGEIYNHVELRRELDYPFRSSSDTEVLIASYQRWGEDFVDRLLGMFAFVLWDARKQLALAARDRFGVKPLYRATRNDGALVLASEIKALHAGGIPRAPDTATWATYLATGLYDHTQRTFWQGVESVAAGTLLTWSPDRRTSVRRWYDLAARVGTDFDTRAESVVREEYTALLDDSIRLRFRADVPVGINLSGGVDSSSLLGLVGRMQGADSDVKAFTFVTGDPAYDELPWVQRMLDRTKHPLVISTLTSDEVPERAEKMLAAQDEPYAGIPTLAYATIFARARAEGVLVLLDGQGIDEQWAGYDYYRSAVSAATAPTTQGAADPSFRVDILAPSFACQAEKASVPTPFPDTLRNIQYRDAVFSKIPRALRFNDRISMASSTELREPFLDHRLFELAFRQPLERKISGDQGKYLFREIAEMLPAATRNAAKRPVQTPQREWLRGPLRDWTDSWIETAITKHPGWLDGRAARAAWQAYASGEGDNSFWVWQLITLGML